MPQDPDDPFDLDGKNLKRVAPAVRKNIRMQRSRIIGHVITLVLCVTVAFIGLQSNGALLIIGFVCALIAPASLIGIFADWQLMRWHRRRLEECERRLQRIIGTTAASKPADS